MKLNNQTILLTGGTGYIGTEIANEILNAGAELILISRNLKNLKIYKNKLSSLYQKKCFIAHCDLTKEQDIKKITKLIKLNYKNINGIVNCAYSMERAHGNIESISHNDFNRSISLNLFSPLKLITNLKKLLINGSKNSKNLSSIINVSSMYGLVSPDSSIYKNKKNINSLHYGATKAGLIQMTKYLACNLDAKNIRVNSVSPGPFPSSKKDTNLINALKNKTPLGRVGNSIEVAKPIIFLLSNDSSYINGVNLPIDGGWTAW